MRNSVLKKLIMGFGLVVALVTPVLGQYEPNQIGRASFRVRV